MHVTIDSLKYRYYNNIGAIIFNLIRLIKVLLILVKTSKRRIQLFKFIKKREPKCNCSLIFRIFAHLRALLVNNLMIHGYASLRLYELNILGAGAKIRIPA